MNARTIYMAYPRKKAPRDAIKAIEKAIKRLHNGEEEGVDETNAQEWLLSVVAEYAASPEGNKGCFVPYPATWFNRSSYLEPKEEWYRDAPVQSAGFNRAGATATAADRARAETFARGAQEQDHQRAGDVSQSPHGNGAKLLKFG